MKNISLLLKEIYTKGERDNVPNISEKNAVFLRNIIRKNRVKYMLEIGTAHAYSTLHFAEELQYVWGKIDTIDVSQVAYEVAQEHIERSWLTENITQYFWDAREIIPLLENSYDLVFIDGLKQASLDFFKLASQKLTPRGIIIIDDVVKFRYKMEDLYDHLEKNNIPYEIIQVDDDDGVMIIEV